MALGPGAIRSTQQLATKRATKNPTVTAATPSIMPGSEGSSVRAMPTGMIRIPEARTEPRPNRSAREPAVKDDITPNRKTTKTRLIWAWLRP
jgi:hypothetical protein